MLDEHEKRFYDAMEKSAEAVPNNADAPLHEPVEMDVGERSMSSSIDETIGHRSGNETMPLSGAVASLIFQGRDALLNRLFEDKKKGDSAIQAEMSQRLDHVSSGQFETSSPQLAEKSKLKIAEVPLTLRERVRLKTGLY